MSKVTTALLSIVAILTALPLPAATVSGRPTVGLALSGGGTKAGAHIGVLRVLEDNRIPVDYIAGTSAGAIIGSLYAAGLSPDEIEAAVAGIDWEDMLEDAPPRRDLPFRRKLDDLNYLVKSRPGYNDGKVELPMGLVQGQKVVVFLRQQYGAYADTRDFDALPIPLRVVTTDLVSGDGVVLGSGDLARAVRASLSLPVFFAPVEIDGQQLIDGGPANNLPVSVVREMGADVVIAVDITAPLLAEDELDSVLSVADQMTNILIQRTVQEQVALLGNDDILIRPDLEGIGGLDFSKTLEPIGAGEEAARTVETALSRLAMGEQEYRDYAMARTRRPAVAAETIRFVVINNNSSIGIDTIESRLGIKAGDALDEDEIRRGIASVYGLDLFELIQYRIEHLESGAGVIIDIVPKPWGPNYLQFGLELAQDFSQGSDFNLGIAYLQTGVNSLGGERRVQLDVGERTGLSMDWYQPVSHRSDWFVEAEALAAQRNFRLFDNNNALADIRIEGFGGTLSGGADIGHYGEIRAGWNRFTGDANVIVGDVLVPDDSVEIGEYFTTLRYDRIDNPNFPREGAYASLGGFWSRKSVGADTDFEQIAGSFFLARSWGNNSIIGRIEGGTTLDDDAPLQSQFLLGGLGRLSGYPAARFVGQHYALATITAYHRLISNLWVPVYAGMSVEAGNVWNNSSKVSSGDLRFAGALYAGADTPLGPLYLAWGLAQGGEDSVYLYLGNPFVAEGARPLD